MKMFNAFVLAGLFAAVVVQATPCADLDIKILKAVDFDVEEKDYLKVTANVQVQGDVSVEDVIALGVTVELIDTPLTGPLASVDFLEEDCTVRGSGKSAAARKSGHDLRSAR